MKKLNNIPPPPTLPHLAYLAQIKVLQRDSRSKIFFLSIPSQTPSHESKIFPRDPYYNKPQNLVARTTDLYSGLLHSCPWTTRNEREARFWNISTNIFFCTLSFLNQDWPLKLIIIEITLIPKLFSNPTTVENNI